MKRTSKRVIGILAAVAILIGLIPMATVFADVEYTATFEVGGHYDPVPQQTVAVNRYVSQPQSPTYNEKAKDYETTNLQFNSWDNCPASELTTENEGQYDTNGGAMFDFATTRIYDDTTLYARWKAQLSIVAYDLTESVSGQGGTVEGGSIVAGVGPSASGGGFLCYAGSNVTVKAEPAEGYIFAGWSTDRTKDGIVSTDKEYTFAFEKKQTLSALFEKKVMLTLKATSIDGSAAIEDYVLDVDPGTSFMDIYLLEREKYQEIENHFANDGYQLFNGGLYILPQTMDNYSSDQEIYRADLWFEDMYENSTLYVALHKKIPKVEMRFVRPVCGVETDTPVEPDGSVILWGKQTNKPKVTVTGGEGYTLSEAENDDNYSTPCWISDETGEGPYIGKFVGGESYYASFSLKADFGYTFLEDTEYTVEDVDEVIRRYFPGQDDDDFDRMALVVKAGAVHDEDAPKSEKVVNPTCTEPGSREDVVYCKACKAELSRIPVKIDALGHDWGEWTVTKEPTETATGLKTRTCKHDSTHVQEKEIPKKTPEKKTTYTITFDLDGGTYKGQTGTYKMDCEEGETITLPKPEKDGYAFDYWEGSKYNAGDKYVVTEDHGFKAIWKKNASNNKTKKETTTKKGKAPKTADENNANIWIVLLLAAALSATVLLVRRKAAR